LLICMVQCLLRTRDRGEILEYQNQREDSKLAMRANQPLLFFFLKIKKMREYLCYTKT